MADAMNTDTLAPITPPKANMSDGVGTVSPPKAPPAPTKPKRTSIISPEQLSDDGASVNKERGTDKEEQAVINPPRVGQPLLGVFVNERREDNNAAAKAGEANQKRNGNYAEGVGTEQIVARKALALNDQACTDQRGSNGTAELELPLDTIMVNDENADTTDVDGDKSRSHSLAVAAGLADPKPAKGMKQVKLNRPEFALHIAGTAGGPPVEFARGKSNVEANVAAWPMYQSYQKIVKTDESTWPPTNVVLQDWHVCKIIEAGITNKEKQQHWRGDFGAEGLPRSTRAPKGRAAKIDVNGKTHYVVIGSFYQLHGDEGGDLPFHKGDKYEKGNKTTLSPGDLCRVQEDYEPAKAELTGGTYEYRYPADEAPSEKKKPKARASGGKRKKPEGGQADGTPAKKGRVEGSQTGGKRNDVKITPQASEASTQPTQVMAAPPAPPVQNSAFQAATSVPAGGFPTIAPIVMNSRRLAAVRAQNNQTTDFYARELATGVVNSAHRSAFTESAPNNIRQGIYDAANAEDEHVANTHLSNTVGYLEAVRTDLVQRDRDIIRSMVNRGLNATISGINDVRRAINTTFARRQYPGGVNARLALPPMIGQLNFSINTPITPGTTSAAAAIAAQVATPATAVSTPAPAAEDPMTHVGQATASTNSTNTGNDNDDDNTGENGDDEEEDEVDDEEEKGEEEDDDDGEEEGAATGGTVLTNGVHGSDAEDGDGN